MEKYRDLIVRDIKELVKIPSVYKESNEYLFGKDVDDCLNKALEIMKDLGFKTFRAEDGAYGYAEIGEGEMMGILGHLDVVPARFEDGWEHEPFEPIEKDGCICGRGTQDDKGPMIVTAYALKALLDEGYKLKNRVRFILGLDEETLWRSIDIYKKREEAPSFGFTPDSEFPLIYAEKGLLQIKVKSAQKSSINFTGGDAFNAVASFADCDNSEQIEQAAKKLNVKYNIKDGKINIEGKTSHAKNPWKGENAISGLATVLVEAGYKDNYIKFISECIHNKFIFEGFSDKDLSDFSGPITVNLSILNNDENGIGLCIDLRLPSTVNKDDVMKIIESTVKNYDLSLEEYDWLDPIYVPVESEYIKTLMSVYVDFTGDTENKASISAGATYARAFKNCVAYGANFPGKPVSEHQPNERVNIDDLLKAGEIYKEVFKRCVTK